jgi:hypothetical protein
MTRQLEGKKYGRLKVLSLNEAGRKRKTWNCECVHCGKREIRTSAELVNRSFPRCACQTCPERKLLLLWQRLMRKYPYAGRDSVSLCDQWRRNAQEFVRWGLDNGYEEGMEFQIRHRGKNLSPRNCYFIAPAIKKRGRPAIHFVTYRGKKYALADFARKFATPEIPAQLLEKRLFRGWEIDRALTEPKNLDVARFICG